jgi:tRNA (guanine37-N1)-methyltransferase
MLFDILTVFPEYFSVLNKSVIGRAISSGKIKVRIANIRDYTKDKHRKTDDIIYGGGAGMLMTPDPIVSAIEDVDPKHEALRIYLSPKGRLLNQKTVEELARYDRVLLLCGDYEGVDERALQLAVDDEISIGDYVLTGGELPAMVLVNCVSRYVHDVLGSDKSTEEESFSNGLLEYPHYTRPSEYRGLRVPDVLLNGNHADIKKWRLEKSLEATMKRRPDLFENLNIGELLPQKPKKKKN